MDNKNEYQAQLFSNRLAKRYRQLRKWARRERITCYRLYDRDIPEIPLAVDLYEFLPSDITTPLEAARFMQNERARESANDLSAAAEAVQRRFARIYLYERPYTKEEADERIWLSRMAQVAAKILGLQPDHLILKMRRHEKGGGQYSENDAAFITDDSGTFLPAPVLTGVVQELGQLFVVDLTSRIDTGLFFDHRPLRTRIRETAGMKAVLNLFCYTGSFSVYAAQGKAELVESVDLSNTYLALLRKNLILNGFTDEQKYPCIRMDVTEFLHQKLSEQPAAAGNGRTNRYDLIILDPPTFSNSKASEHTLDINKDWSSLVNDCLDLLLPGGTLYFSTNSRRLTFDTELVHNVTKTGKAVAVIEQTEESLPADYQNAHPHRLWRLQTGK
ncbi:MAG: class I SAM-dependent methyltransferase [Treponema sp.]|jgi:23S rRNA (cytosine1962-C5)-methyltransferase|nr:class I SAM-dependent methyltransferase [Treponema sp.]